MLNQVNDINALLGKGSHIGRGLFPWIGLVNYKSVTHIIVLCILPLSVWGLAINLYLYEIQDSGRKLC